MLRAVGPALVLDKDGMVVAGYGMAAAPGDQVALPGGLTAGVVRHRMFGHVLLEPLPHGKCWLLREVSPGHEENVRSLMCRIRGEVWGLLESEPYRFGDQLTVEPR